MTNKPRERKNRTKGECLVRNSEGYKLCYYCSKWLSTKRFSRHPRSADRMSMYCNRCIVLQRHQLTYEMYAEMLIEQDGRCFICKIKFTKAKNIHIDHDHKCCNRTYGCTNCIRSLLCSNCNMGIGKFMDDPKLLIKAANYLRKTAK